MKSRFTHTVSLTALAVGFFFFSLQASRLNTNLRYGYTLLGLDLEELSGNGDFTIPDYQRVSSTLGEEFSPDTNIREYIWAHYGDGGSIWGFRISLVVIQSILVILSVWGWVIFWRELRAKRMRVAVLDTGE